MNGSSGAGHRPCAVCLPDTYAPWKEKRKQSPGDTPMSPAEDARSPVEGAARSDSPRLRTPVVDNPGPVAHTAAELAALIGLLTAPRSRIRSVAVGHGRDADSRTAAQAFVRAWGSLHRDVLAVVDWPEDAASWLRPARRLTAQAPDAWVLAAAPLGTAQLVRRLRHSTDWDPARTFGFASLSAPRLVELAGADTVHGLRGAFADGGTWDLRRGWTTRYAPVDVTSAQRSGVPG
ncbi:hypothetical protein [Streptomyces sp. NPDC048155]|uniref:hypothetical protein n=1 Tax=unclassified Streptomyces TaxID=2593676 RepID=UPI0033E7A7E8